MMSTLTPKGYRPRLIEGRLDMLMRGFGCVEITGPKWCGKTWTALTRSQSATHLDDASDRAAAEVDPSLALVGTNPHLVDEWQEVPGVWDACRRAIDDSGNHRGLYLLTGSTNLPKNQRDQVRHTGAGRIARLSMHPMALIESGDAPGGVSLRSLFAGNEMPSVRADASIQQVARWCCRGGWPANLGLGDDVAAETAAQYVQSVADINVMEEGRSPSTALSLLRALALNESQAATYKTLIRDMADGAIISEETVPAYLELFDRLHITEPLGGWEPPLRAKARVRVKPKRYFADPSLAAALLGATPDRLLRDTQTLGMLFENLVLRDLSVFLSTYGGMGNKLSYYRDDKGLEVDFIAESGGAWAGLEVKLSDTKVDEAAGHLLKLKDKVTSNPRAQNSRPAFLAVIVGRGGLAYTRPDGVHVIPMTALEP